MKVREGRERKRGRKNNNKRIEVIGGREENEREREREENTKRMGKKEDSECRCVRKERGQVEWTEELRRSNKGRRTGRTREEEV